MLKEIEEHPFCLQENRGGSGEDPDGISGLEDGAVFLAGFKGTALAVSGEHELHHAQTAEGHTLASGQLGRAIGTLRHEGAGDIAQLCGTFRQSRAGEVFNLGKAYQLTQIIRINLIPTQACEQALFCETQTVGHREKDAASPRSGQCRINFEKPDSRACDRLPVGRRGRPRGCCCGGCGRNSPLPVFRPSQLQACAAPPLRCRWRVLPVVL